LCDIFAKLNTLNISMQRLDKNMFDASHNIAAFNQKLSLWNEDIANVLGSSQCFSFLSNFLEK